MYLKVSISDFLTLFSVRTSDRFFWTSRPSTILILAAGFALSLSTILALAWPASTLDGVYALGLGYRVPKGLVVYVWLFCIGFWFIQDAAKVSYLYEYYTYSAYYILCMGSLRASCYMCALICIHSLICMHLYMYLHTLICNHIYTHIYVYIHSLICLHV